MDFMAILQFLWTVMTTITMLPVGLYLTLATYSPKFLSFLFFSGSHVWWHNLIVGFVWFSLYSFFCIIFWEWLKGAYRKHSEVVEEKYGIKLLSFSSVMAYLMVIIIPLMTKLPAFAVREDLWWTGVLFVLPLWIYYLIKARLGFFFVLLRQLYLLFVFFITMSVMFLPAIAIFFIQMLIGSAGSSAQDSRPQEHIVRTTTTYEDGSQSTEDSRRYY